jgi:hypothetical protein
MTNYKDKSKYKEETNKTNTTAQTMHQITFNLKSNLKKTEVTTMIKCNFREYIETHGANILVGIQLSSVQLQPKFHLNASPNTQKDVFIITIIIIRYHLYTGCLPGINHVYRVYSVAAIL